MLGCHFENHYRISKLLNAGCEQSNQGEVTASPDSAIFNIFENFNKTENWPDLMSGGVCFYDIPSSSELFLWRVHWQPFREEFSFEMIPVKLSAPGKITYLYIGLVALSLNQSMRVTSCRV